MDTRTRTDEIQDVRESDDRDAVLRAIVEQLDLDNPDLEINKRGSEDFAAALHEEDSRGIILWASRHESDESVRLLRTYGDQAASMDVSRRSGLRSRFFVGVQM